MASLSAAAAQSIPRHMLVRLTWTLKNRSRPSREGPSAAPTNRMPRTLTPHLRNIGPTSWLQRVPSGYRVRRLPAGVLRMQWRAGSPTRQVRLGSSNGARVVHAQAGPPDRRKMMLVMALRRAGQHRGEMRQEQRSRVASLRLIHFRACHDQLDRRFFLSSR